MRPEESHPRGRGQGRKVETRAPAFLRKEGRKGHILVKLFSAHIRGARWGEPHCLMDGYHHMVHVRVKTCIGPALHNILAPRTARQRSTTATNGPWAMMLERVMEGYCIRLPLGSEESRKLPSLMASRISPLFRTLPSVIPSNTTRYLVHPQTPPRLRPSGWAWHVKTPSTLRHQHYQLDLYEYKYSVA